MGPQSMDLEVETSLVRAVSLQWWGEGGWKPVDLKLNHEVRICGRCVWTVPRERACEGRRKTGWKFGQCGLEGKVGVWTASGKDPVHSQEKWSYREERWHK